MRVPRNLQNHAWAPVLVLFVLGATYAVYGQGNPLAGGATLAGIYTDDNLKLDLRPAEAGYSGTLSMQGNVWPLSARSQGQQLSGTFRTDGGNYPFTATWTGTDLVLESGGATYRLRKQQEKRANPLAAGGANMAPEERQNTGAIARASLSLGPPLSAGELSLRLPAGWTYKADGSGDVALLPPGTTAQSVAQELYVAMLPGYENANDPEAAADVEEDFIPEGVRASARRSSEQFQTSGRSAVVHSWKFQRPDNGQPITVSAYLAETDGEVVEVLATLAGDLAPQRDLELRAIVGAIQQKPGGSTNPGAMSEPGFQGNPAGARGEFQAGGAEPAGAQQRQAKTEGAMSGIQLHPQAPPLVPGQISDNQPQSLQWVNHLRGKRLSRYARGGGDREGGWTSRERMLLYPDGRFEYQDSSQFSLDTGGTFGSGSNRSAKTGTWRILTVNGTSFLALLYQGSTAEEYAELDFRENKTFIDGSRVLVTAP